MLRSVKLRQKCWGQLCYARVERVKSRQISRVKFGYVPLCLVRGLKGQTRLGQSGCVLVAKCSVKSDTSGRSVSFSSVSVCQVEADMSGSVEFW